MPRAPVNATRGLDAIRVGGARRRIRLVLRARQSGEEARLRLDLVEPNGVYDSRVAAVLSAGSPFSTGPLWLAAASSAPFSSCMPVRIIGLLPEA